MLESERTLAWLNRNRRRAKGFRNSIATAVAWIMIAGVIIRKTIDQSIKQPAR